MVRTRRDAPAENRVVPVGGTLALDLAMIFDSVVSRELFSGCEKSAVCISPTQSMTFTPCAITVG
jgi:hypothetical protein